MTAAAASSTQDGLTLPLAATTEKPSSPKAANSPKAVGSPKTEDSLNIWLWVLTGLIVAPSISTYAAVNTKNFAADQTITVDGVSRTITAKVTYDWDNGNKPNSVTYKFEKTGGIYEMQGDYLIPCLTLPAEKEKPIGVLGQRHLQYLKEYQRVTYINLLTGSKLNAYLADIDGQAQERFEMLVEQMKQAQGITEQLKAEKPMEWVQRVNNIRACAMEIVNKEIIYS